MSGPRVSEQTTSGPLEATTTGYPFFPLTLMSLPVLFGRRPPCHFVFGVGVREKMEDRSSSSTHRLHGISLRGILAAYFSAWQID
jgi:hypothetical protein